MGWEGHRGRPGAHGTQRVDHPALRSASGRRSEAAKPGGRPCAPGAGGHAAAAAAAAPPPAPGVGEGPRLGGPQGNGVVLWGWLDGGGDGADGGGAGVCGPAGGARARLLRQQARGRRGRGPRRSAQPRRAAPNAGGAGGKPRVDAAAAAPARRGAASRRLRVVRPRLIDVMPFTAHLDSGGSLAEPCAAAAGPLQDRPRQPTGPGRAPRAAPPAGGDPCLPVTRAGANRAFRRRRRPRKEGQKRVTGRASACTAHHTPIRVACRRAIPWTARRAGRTTGRVPHAPARARAHLGGEGAVVPRAKNAAFPQISLGPMQLSALCCPGCKNNHTQMVVTDTVQLG